MKKTDMSTLKTAEAKENHYSYPGYWGLKNPDKPAIILSSTGESMTHAQLNKRSNQIAHLLRDTGLGRGDHIALLMENHLEYLPIVWASLRAGLYITAINWHLTAEEAAYIVEDCEAKVLFSSVHCANIAAPIAAKHLKRRIMVDKLDSFATNLNNNSAAWENYHSVLLDYSTEPIADESNGQVMLYSSGTTGRPKGVLRPLPATPYWELPAAERPATIAQPYDFNEDTVYLSPAPLYHAAPLSFCREAQARGGTAVIMDRFKPHDALQAIEDYGVTHSQWVPTMFVRMLELPEEERLAYNLSSQKMALHAAAPCPKEIKYKMLDWWGPIIHEYYGGSEGFGSTRIGPKEWLAHPGSVGKITQGETFILDENFNELPTGEQGLIYFKAKRKFQYKGDEQKTADATSPQGYRSFGDVGYIDKDNYLYLTDRKSFMIISGGVNIYPRETEDILQMHPFVADVAVFGIPHPEFGEEVKAAVELKQGYEPSPELEENIIAYCQERLAKFKCPRSIDFEAKLPRLPSGKLRKSDLRQPYWAESNRSN